MTDDIASPSDAAPGLSPIFGVVVGLVAKVDGDPEQLNRVLVDFPTLQVRSAWARVASFAAGPDRGAFFFPQESDEVLVAFEHGDASRPYVVGALWNGVDPPPVAAEKVHAVGRITMKSGAHIEFDDSDGGSSITIADKKGNRIVVDTGNDTVTIFAGKDIALTAQGKLTLTAGEVEIKATTGGLALSTVAEGSLEAGKDVTIRGGNIRLN